MKIKVFFMNASLQSLFLFAVFWEIGLFYIWSKIENLSFFLNSETNVVTIRRLIWTLNHRLDNKMSPPLSPPSLLIGVPFLFFSLSLFLFLFLFLSAFMLQPFPLYLVCCLLIKPLCDEKIRFLWFVPTSQEHKSYSYLKLSVNV